MGGNYLGEFVVARALFWLSGERLARSLDIILHLGRLADGHCVTYPRGLVDVHTSWSTRNGVFVDRGVLLGILTELDS